MANNYIDHIIDQRTGDTIEFRGDAYTDMRDPTALDYPNTVALTYTSNFSWTANKRGIIVFRFEPAGGGGDLFVNGEEILYSHNPTLVYLSKWAMLAKGDEVTIKISGTTVVTWVKFIPFQVQYE